MSDVNEKSNQGTLVKPAKIEKVLPKEAPERDETPEVSPKVTISIDQTPEEVVSYDQAGYILYFEDDPDRFLDLPVEVIQELSPRSRAAFSVAFTFYQKLKEERVNPPSGVKVIPSFSSAQKRLKVNRSAGLKEKMHECWIRPDQVNEFLGNGYKVVNDKDTQTFNSDPGTTHTVGVNGETELLLVEVPKADYDLQQAALADKAVGKSRAVEQAMQADIARAGGAPPERFGARANTPKKKEVIRTKVR